jgi:hypothetical protein
MSIEQPFTSIDSKHISGARYNSLDRTLDIQFRNGSVYRARDVSPEDHQAFMDAPSQGSHYHRVVKNSFHIVQVK